MCKKRELFQALLLWSMLHWSIHEERRRVCEIRKGADKTFKTFAWNKSDDSMLDYQQKYCETRCDGTKLFTYSVGLKYTECWDLECTPCHCERPTCEHYGICCPNISVQFERKGVVMGNVLEGSMVEPSNISGPALRKRSATPILGCDYHPDLLANYLFIRSCQPGYDDNQTVIDLCEMDRQPHEQTIETFIKVVDLERQIVYRNKFCALCNHVTNYTSVPTTILSTNFITYYNAKSRDEMLQQVLQGDVEITPAFPENFTLLGCLFLRVPIDHCGSMRSRSLVDEDLIRACETNHHGNEFVVLDLLTKTVYKNIFCAICNRFEYPRTYPQCKCHIKIRRSQPLPFSLLLDLSSSTRIERTDPRSVFSIQASQCSFNEWSSLNGDCHPLLCGPGKVFLDGKCTAEVEEIKGLSYRLRLWLQPVPSDRQKLYSLVLTDVYARKTFYSLFNKLKEMLEEFSKGFSLAVRGLEDPTSIMFLKFPVIFWMECLLFAHSNISRNDLDFILLNRFLSENMSVQNFAKVNLIVKPIQMLRRFDVANTELQSLINQKQYQADVRDDAIPTGVTITIDLNGTKILITDTADLNMVDIGQDGELNVCEDLLNSKLKMSKADVSEGTNRELAGTSLAEYIVSIACSSASILCLVLTLMTYVLFSELRTEAGLNNMFLSSSLLLAQVCLLITSHIFMPSLWCTVLGVVTHFLWLWMFSWSFLCSYHMFQVFSSNSIRTSSQDRLKFWKKILFSLTCPTVIILTTVVCSYLASAGQEKGYGRFSCYLNSTLLVGLTLVWPLSLVTLTNVVFFIVAVHKIHGVLKLQSIFRKYEQNTEWYIYVKMSSVTGAFWTVAILAAALDNTILKLISIVLNGLQGVAIFVSFICNKRVLLLYKQMTSSNQESTTDELRLKPIQSN